jgi:hypothetical protein
MSKKSLSLLRFNTYERRYKVLVLKSRGRVASVRPVQSLDDQPTIQSRLGPTSVSCFAIRSVMQRHPSMRTNITGRYNKFY